MNETGQLVWINFVDLQWLIWTCLTNKTVWPLAVHPATRPCRAPWRHAAGCVRWPRPWPTAAARRSPRSCRPPPGATGWSNFLRLEKIGLNHKQYLVLGHQKCWGIKSSFVCCLRFGVLVEVNHFHVTVGEKWCHEISESLFRHGWPRHHPSWLWLGRPWPPKSDGRLRPAICGTGGFQNVLN